MGSIDKLNVNGEDYSVTDSSAQESINQINTSLDNMSGLLKKVASLSANGTAGTYYSEVELDKTKNYFVLIRPTNDSSSLTVSPIIGGYSNPTYVSIKNNKIGLIFTATWGFGTIYEIS